MKDVWIAVRALIEKGWTQKMAARNRAGQRTNSSSLEACQWCIMGALWKVIGGHDDSLYVQALKDKLGGVDPSIWNDEKDRTQSDILQLLDEMINEA